nr:hypothetical protein [Tanacetum cinerariifolium]
MTFSILINKLMEQLTSMCDMVGQYIQKKEEEKRIEKEQAAKARYWKIPVCNNNDDDEDYTIAITPILSTEEPDNSLSMGDEHLDTILASKSDEFIKSSVENLVPIPNQFEDFSNSNDDSTSIDDDSFFIDNIEYVEASPPDFELISSEVMEIFISEVGGIDANILLTIKNDILREKSLNINILIANIEALKDNPTPYSDFMTKFSSTSLNFLLEETNTFDNSLPESKTFCFNLEEISSGSTNTRSDISLPDYEAFYDDHVKDISSGSTTLILIFLFMIRSSLIFRSIHFLLSIGLIFMSSSMNSLTSYLHQSMIGSALRMNPTRGISL